MKHMDETTEISVKKVKHRPLYLICIEMQSGVLMCHAVSKHAFDKARFNVNYSAEFGIFNVCVKYPPWLDVEAVRQECYDYMVGTGATHAV